MDVCSQVRESLSAFVDGEDGVLPRAECDSHVEGCRACATFAVGLAPLVRASRLHTAQEVPDLTAAVMASAAAHVQVGDEVRRQQVRWTLGLVGAMQAVMAVAALTLDGSHLGRELAAWQLALGVGFVVAAWQPTRAAGLLPMVGVLALAAVVSAVGDLFSGATTLAAELPHLVEVAGVALVWSLARHHDGLEPATLALHR